MPGASPAAGDDAPALSGSSWTPVEALPDAAVVSLKHLVEAELNATLLSVTATPSGSSGGLAPANLVLPLDRVPCAFACKGALDILSKTPALGHPALSLLECVELTDFQAQVYSGRAEAGACQIKVTAVPKRGIKTCSAAPRVQLPFVFIHIFIYRS